MSKLTSRKFWMCTAAFLASIATSIAGIRTDNQTIIIIGTICGILSAAVYAFCEAWVDSKATNAYMDVLKNLSDALLTDSDNKEDNENE